MFRKVSWELTLTYVMIIVFSMAILGIFLLNFIEAHFTESARQDLYRQAQLIAESWPRSVRMDGPTATEIHFYWNMIDRISHQTGYRIRVLTDRGIPVYDTGGDAEPDVSICGEVKQALMGKSASGRDENGFSQSYPVFEYSFTPEDRHVAGVIYVTRSKTYLNSILSYVKGQFYLGFLISLAVSLMLALLFSHYITKPVVSMTRQADMMARGDLRQRVVVKTRNELGTLSERFNLMADKLQGTMDQLMGEKNKLEAIINSIAAGVMVIDERKRLVLINDTAVELLGLRSYDLLGKRIGTVIPGHSLLQLVEDSELEIEVRQTLDDIPDGKAVDAYLSPLSGDDERPTGAVIILTDVTEFHRLDKLRTEFVSNVSHELKTPLASIKGLAELLIDGALGEERAVEFLNSINREVDRLTRLVKDLLDLSKMESGMVKIDVQPVSVHETFRQVLMKLTPQANRKEIEIMTEFSCDGPVLANSDRLQQVLINLLDNAIRYTKQGDKILLVSRRKDTFCHVEVKDTGPGISSENLERVFERFYRADRSRSRDEGGFGLGLAISKQIIENMGGTLGVNSTPPCGTTFYFTVPFCAEDSEDSEVGSLRSEVGGV